MQLQTTARRARYQITQYDKHSIKINDVTHERPFLLNSEELQILEFDSFKALDEMKLAAILQAYEPELLLISTGQKMEILAPELQAYLQTHHVGYETMDLGAACRTYNLLQNEKPKLVFIAFF